MNHASDMRRARRKSIDDVILVEDAIRNEALGRIGNISRSGLMLICSERLNDDALYQIRFSLPTPDGSDGPPMEVGVHEQWTEQASVPGQFWSGVRILSIRQEDEARLLDWLARS